MLSHRYTAAAVIAASLVARIASGATATVNFNSGGLTLRDNLSVSLNGGTSTNGNGDVIQLGYYSSGSSSNNFLGTWIPLTGNGSANTGNIAGDNTGLINLNQTSIGDLTAGGAGNGTFALQVTFDTLVANKSQNLPSLTSIPLVIRFYNDTTIAGSTFYNAVSSDIAGWKWQTPADAPAVTSLNLSLDDTGLEWESTAIGQSPANAGMTTIAVPEPSVALLALGSLGLLAARRRRNA